MENISPDNLIKIPSDNILYYEALLFGLDDVVISTDKNFIIKTWNGAAEKVYGIKASEAIGKSSTLILKSEYLSMPQERAIQFLLEQDYWKGTVKASNKNGEIRFLQVTINVLKNKSGKKTGYVGVSRDITENLKQQQSLQNFVAILTLLEESFLIIDRNYKLVFFRPKGNIQEFFNSDYKIGDNAFKYVPAYLFEKVKTLYRRAFAGNVVQLDVETKTNPKCYLNITYAPLKDDLGNIDNVCVIIKDLTTQKEMELLIKSKAEVEKKLHESRNLFEEFMENSPLLAWVVDENAFIHYINPTYFKALGSPENIIGKNLADIYDKEHASRYLANIKKVATTKNTLETIEVGRIPNTESSFKIVKFPIHYKNMDMIAGWAVNITDQLAIQESLSHLNQHKDKLVSIIAHDLRGPLGVNASYLKSIIEDYDSYLKDELFTSLQLIEKSASKCHALVDDLLRWAQGQLSHISFNPKIINIQTEILKTADNLWDQLHEKNIELKTEFNFYGDVFVDGDMFSIVVRNFISNAIKFSHPGSTIKVQTSVYNKNEVLISIKDSGVGMKKELVEKLLQKLNFKSTYGTKGERGTGLGLIIAKEYVEQNGGKMGIHSEENKGTDFNFTVPVFSGRKD